MKRLFCAKALFLVGIALVPALFSGCAQNMQPSRGGADLRAEIEALNRRFMQLSEQRDAAALAALYTDDAQFLMAGSAPVVGREAIQALMRGGKVDLRTLEVEGMGETAYELGAYTFYNDAGQPIDNGNYIVIWKRVGGEWKLHRDMIASHRPARRQ